MSLLIKGMDMPKYIGKAVTIYPDGSVIDYHGSGPKEVVGYAVEVPVEQERLIEREEGENK